MHHNILIVSMEDQASMSTHLNIAKRKQGYGQQRTGFQSKRMITFARQNDDSKYDNIKYHDR